MTVDAWTGSAISQMLTWAGASLTQVVTWLAPVLAFYFLVDLLLKKSDD